MIEAVIETKSGEVLNIELPVESIELYEETMSIGAGNPKNIYLSEDMNRKASLKLYGSTSVGSNLLSMLSDKSSLMDANTLCCAFEKAHAFIQPELEQKILENKYATAEEMYSDIRQMTRMAGKVYDTYYFPLCGYVEDDYYGETFDADNSMLVEVMEDISRRIEEEQSPEYGDLAQYFRCNYEMDDKVISAVWGVELINGELYGKTDVVLDEKLWPHEELYLKEWIEGQNSDGFGEGFEQRPIETEDGSLYVSMWSSGDDYFIYNREEMSEYLGQSFEMMLS